MRRTLALAVIVLTTISLNFNAAAQSKSREQILEEIKTKRVELDKLEKEFLEPTAADRERYAELLSKPQTGLIRLLPREKYDSDVATYRNFPKTITTRGGGAYYSFTRLTHEYGFGADISFGSDSLSVGFAGADYGMLINIGDVDLLEVSIDSPQVATLARYQPARSEPEARIEQRRFGTGTTIEDLNLKNRLTAEVNATYLLRSVNYNESDVLVACRIVRQDSDDSLIIAWKLLHKYSKPTLARN